VKVFNGWRNVQAAWADPGQQGSNLSVAEFPTFHLLRLASLAKGSAVRRYLDPVGMSVPEWRLLSAVAHSSPITFADIAITTTMDKGQVSRALRVAQTKGYVVVELTPTDRPSSQSGAASGNRVVVSITPAGRELYEQVMPIAQRFQAELIELMNPDERQMMLGLLQRLNEYFDAEAKQE
jgi:DNA-binding MarR family transcriptional regulator